MELNPELRKTYTCERCEKVTTSIFGICINLSHTNEENPDEDTENEWPYYLCSDCFYKWFDGRVSTEALIDTCNTRIENRALRRKLAAIEKPTK